MNLLNSLIEEVELNSEEYYLIKGYILYLKSLYNDSLKYFKKALEINKSSSLTWSLKGNVFLAQNRLLLSFVSFKHSLTYNPTNETAKLGISNLLSVIGLYGKSINTSLKLLENSLMPQSVLNNIGLNLFYLNENRKALTLYSKLIIKYPESAGLHANYSWILFKSNMLDSAIETGKISVELDPDTSMSWNNLGYYYQQKKMYDEALKAYHEALILDSNNLYAINNKRNILIECAFKNELIDYTVNKLEVRKNKDIKAYMRRFVSIGGLTITQITIVLISIIYKLIWIKLLNKSYNETLLEDKLNTIDFSFYDQDEIV